MKHARGFTIIEVMLVLAISSLMALVLMVATGVTIQRQQYRDSVQSFANFMTNQYSRVISVENERANNEPCPLAGAPVVPIGQSNCIVVGRYIQTEGNSGDIRGTDYGVYPVYALKTGGVWQYGLGLKDTDYKIGWSGKSRMSNQPESNASLSVLMYRDPDHGMVIIHTNTGRYTQDAIGDFFRETGASTDQEREICVYDNGWMPAERRSVFLGLRAGSSDAVTIGNATEACKDEA